MSRDFVRQICQALPGAECSDPWGGGYDAWKVGGNMFACIGAKDQDVVVKTSDPESAAMMIETGDAERAKYVHNSCILLPWGGDAGLMRDRILVSYDIIRAGLPRRVQAGLPVRAA